MDPQVAVVLLAAGSSARMGQPKQLLPFRGRSLLRHSIEVALASGCAPVLVVLGRETERLWSECQGLAVEVVENPGWAEGVASSIRQGIRALPRTADAVILMACDQPLVSPDHLRALAHAHARIGKPIAASAYDATLGVPALFDRRLFPELMRLTGPRGAKGVILEHRESALAVPFPEAAVDVDTPEDYERITSEERA